MYSGPTQIHRWLLSITDSDQHQSGRNHHCDRGADIAHETRQCKRRKIHRPVILSPPPSQPLTKTVMSASSGRKRTRHDGDDDQYPSEASSNPQLPEEVHNEETPRASKFLLMQPREPSGRDSPSQLSSASNRSASISSHSISISNRSSPTKQFRNAEMQETGFNVGSFRLDQHPESLKKLCIQLRDISYGHAILPASLRHEFSDSEIPPYAFKPDESTPVDDHLPSVSWVQKLLERAAECYVDRECEASWNADVHAPILEQVFRSDRFGSSDLTDFRCCPTAQILPAFKPRDAPSKMVDFCIFVRPTGNSVEKESITAICQSRPGFSINHTDLGNFCKHPIALSIETKRPGENGDKATLQMGTWHSSQWRSLRYPLFQPRATRSIEFLPGIIIQGHDWHFVATILDGNNKALLLTGVRIGGTETELAVYSLVVALQHLRQWIKDVYWPAFIADMLQVHG